MLPSNPKRRYPQWVPITLAFMVMACVGVLTVALCNGKQFDRSVAAAVFALGAYVVRRVV
jgi:hypothetical protein